MIVITFNNLKLYDYTFTYIINTEFNVLLTKSHRNQK